MSTNKPLETDKTTDTARKTDASAISAQEHELLLQNEDYLLVHSALEVLREQLKQAECDLKCLTEFKEQAKNDPTQFVLSLCNKTRPSLPTLQPIVSIPNIELEKYGKAYGESSKAFTNDKTNDDNSFMVNAHQASLKAFQNYELSRPPPQMLNGTTPSLVSIVKQAAERLPPRVASPDASTDEQDLAEDTPPRPNKRQKSGASDAMSGAEDNTHTPVGEVRQSQKSKQTTSTVPDTFNMPWTDEELERLEQLMKIIPDEGVTAERYRRIAAALGTRTDKQVGSRIQRLMNKENYNGNTKLNLSQSTYRVTGAVYLNLAPSVLMPDQATTDTISSHEKPVTVHYGFSCDGCQAEPIVGTRWKCLDCPEAEQVDLCDSCYRIGEFENDVHRIEHKYEAWTEPEAGDGSTASYSNNDAGNDYAYLGLGT